MTNIRFEEGGQHTIHRGEVPLRGGGAGSARGVIQLPERTLTLLSGPFSPEYVPDLIQALKTAYAIAERDEPWVKFEGES